MAVREYSNSAYIKDLESDLITTDEVFIRYINMSLPLTSLGDGEEIYLHAPFTAPSGATLKIVECGVAKSDGSTDSDLTIEVYDLGNTTVLESRNSDYEYGEPLTSVDVGGKTIVVRIANATGGVLDVGGFMNGCLVI